MPNLEKRRQLWYALLTVPEDARKTLGRLRFRKSTGTSNRREAAVIAAQYVAGWKLLIKQARGDNNVHLNTAIRWRADIEKTSDALKKRALKNRLLDEVGKIEESTGFTNAKAVYEIATGIKTPSIISYEEWKAQLNLEPKTTDQMTRDVKHLIDHFTTLESITATSAFEWADKLKSQGKTISSRIRIMKGCKNYWRYLKSRKLAAVDSYPFNNVVVKPTGKASRKIKANAPYTPEQIVMIWNAALSQTKYGKLHSDQQLADLVLICAYTGNRIEEICSLKIANMTEHSFKFIESKTEAGIREVPIHSKLLPTIKRLKEQSKDGYLLTGLPQDKYGKRAGLLGKRFGVLKTKLGFSSRIYTAHSFRSTLVTMLEIAGVPENLTADIVGHKKPRITYGLYSGGATLDVMRKALEKVKYPFST